MFEDLTKVLKKNTTYKILNVQVVSTDEKQIPESENLVQLNLAPKLEIES